MLPRAWRNAVLVGLAAGIALLLSVAIDAIVLPGRSVAWLYVVPVLVAALWLPPWPVIGVGLLAIIAQVIGAVRQGGLLVDAGMAAAGLAVVTLLAVLLARQRDAAAAATKRSRLLRALHEAALSLAGPAPPNGTAVATLLGQIVARAKEALGAVDGGVVLVEDPAWADLVPGTDARDGAIWLDFRHHFGRRRVRPEGATAAVLASGRPVIVPDIASESTFGSYEALRQRAVRAFAITPLRTSDQVLGTLSVNFALPHQLSPTDQDLLMLFGAHAAAALDRVRLAFAERQVARQAEQLARHEAETEALREVDRLKDELLVTIAHELRTPLTVLYGYSLRLRARADRLEPAEVERTADRMVAASTQLRRLVEDLLDFANLQHGHVSVHPEEMDLAPALYGLVEAFRTHTGGERIVGTWPEHLSVYADPARLEQVVGNILENALRYAPEGPIALRAAGSESSRHMVRVEVQDQGPGIPQDEQARVWDRFFRGARVAGLSVARGSGIGLSVVKTLVEAQGGRVGLESAVGHGARFWIELPAVPVADPPETRGEPHGAETRGG